MASFDAAFLEKPVSVRCAQGEELIFYRGEAEAGLGAKLLVFVTELEPARPRGGGLDAAGRARLRFAKEVRDGEVNLHTLGAGAADNAADSIAEEEAAEAEECEFEVGDGEGRPDGYLGCGIG